VSCPLFICVVPPHRICDPASTPCPPYPHAHPVLDASALLNLASAVGSAESMVAPMAPLLTVNAAVAPVATDLAGARMLKRKVHPTEPALANGNHSHLSRLLCVCVCVCVSYVCDSSYAPTQGNKASGMTSCSRPRPCPTSLPWLVLPWAPGGSTPQCSSHKI
jgi:hypothetical protein